MKQTTLCYVENDRGQTLLLHRTKKQNDMNRDKWIGIGGKFESGETPEQCLLREVKEETGLTLTAYRYRGIVTFHSAAWESEQMHLFTAHGFTGTLTDCNEGTLEWVDNTVVPTLPTWEGDRIFLDLLRQNVPFFELTLTYDEHEALVSAVLNGNRIQ